MNLGCHFIRISILTGRKVFQPGILNCLEGSLPTFQRVGRVAQKATTMETSLGFPTSGGKKKMNSSEEERLVL